MPQMPMGPQPGGMMPPHFGHGIPPQPTMATTSQGHGSHAVIDTTGAFEGMQYRVDHRDSNSLLSMNLQPNYQVKGKPGSMVAMAGTVQIKGKVCTRLSFVNQRD